MKAWAITQDGVIISAGLTGQLDIFRERAQAKQELHRLRYLGNRPKIVRVSVEEIAAGKVVKR